MKVFIHIILLVLCSFVANAQLTLSQIFQDNMVLQQESEVQFWG